jgi:hypothetical protein
LGWALYERLDGRPLVEAVVLGHGVVDVAEWVAHSSSTSDRACSWVTSRPAARSSCPDCQVDELMHATQSAHVIAVERVQSYGISGASLLRTAEVGGAIMFSAGPRGRWIDRASVKRGLSVTGAKGSADAAVRQRLIELHGGSKEVAVGTKKAPGPLYGVKSHAWAALAVAVVVADTLETSPGPSFGADGRGGAQ